jgi:quercetin dioxygenase-like cupin family protein
MKVITAGEVKRFQAPAPYFTGTAWVDPCFEAPAPARVSASRVTFEAGARTAWHSHPLGQMLHVLSGEGFIQWKDGPAQVIRTGDTVWIGPNELHAHGAAPGGSMCHMAIQESLDGSSSTFGPELTDDEYRRPFAAV